MCHDVPPEQEEDAQFQVQNPGFGKAADSPHPPKMHPPPRQVAANKALS